MKKNAYRPVKARKTWQKNIQNNQPLSLGLTVSSTVLLETPLNH